MKMINPRNHKPSNWDTPLKVGLLALLLVLLVEKFAGAPTTPLRDFLTGSAIGLGISLACYLYFCACEREEDDEK